MGIEDFETLTDDEVRKRAAVIPDAIYPLLNPEHVRATVALSEPEELDFMLAMLAARDVASDPRHKEAMAASGLSAIDYTVSLGIPAAAFEPPPEKV